MAMRQPINPGKVDWSGENPGIYLKHTAEGPYCALALFFRVVLSPHGRGTAMLIVGDPDSGAGWPHASNLMIADNQALARYLVDDFAVHFPTFRRKPGLKAATLLPLTSATIEGDRRGRYVETVASGELKAVMTWDRLGEPFAVAVMPEQSATGAHEMVSTFLEAKEASISVGGKRIAGEVMTRQFFGRTMSTAFLAFAETWITPAKATKPAAAIGKTRRAPAARARKPKSRSR
jgi:hypothetical protein